jgi:subtilisin family serine protease
VINLSLVSTPADEDIIKFGFDSTEIAAVRAGLAIPFKVLSDLGVVFAASSGNDSSPMDPMNMSECRYGPRYPAAFLYDGSNPVPTMIPVGAVDKDGKPASYSNYPGVGGIATYGGSLLTPVEPLNHPHDVTHVQQPIDALLGVYSSSRFPALSKDDTAPFQSPPPPDYPEYAAPNPDAWAYWSGTSFATPIISALAARVLELKSSGILKPDVSVPQTIISAAGERTTLWNRLRPDANGMCNEECFEDDCVSGPLIMAFQECRSTTPPIQ